MYIKFDDFLNEELIAGGKGSNTKISDLNADELSVGIEVELEHTDDKKIAQEIATDHLTEDPKYYSKLIQKGIADEPRAIEKAKKLGWI
jgi:hypothetical protein